MGIAIDNYWGIETLEQPKVLEIRVIPVALQPCLSVNFDYEVMIHDVLEQIHHQFVIPGLIIDALAILARIETDFVHVAHDVKAALIDHCHHLREKGPDYILDVAMKFLLHTHLESLKLAIDIHHITRIVDGRNEMHRTDAIIQRQLLEIFIGRAITLAHLVNFHRRVKVDALAVGLAQARHLIKIGQHVLACHVDRALGRHWRVRCEAQMGKPQGQGLDDKILHRGMSVTELRVGVEVI